MNNATIISTATVANSFVNGSTTTNNHTTLLEIIPDEVEVALAVNRAISQPTNSVLCFTRRLTRSAVLITQLLQSVI